MSANYQCDECGKIVNCEHVTLVNRQRHGEYKQMGLCPKCNAEYEKSLELTRQNFQAQFGEKPIQDSSKPATDNIHAYSYELHNDSKHVDIHKIIDDAMEKKDRSVTIFIGKEATTVSVYPYEDKPREWILDSNADKYPFICPECGLESEFATVYCPHCGEKLQRPSK